MSDGFSLTLTLSHWQLWPVTLTRQAKPQTTGWWFRWLCVDCYVPTKRYR